MPKYSGLRKQNSNVLELKSLKNVTLCDIKETYVGLSQVRVLYLTPMPHALVQLEKVEDQELHCPSIGSGIGLSTQTPF